MAKSKGRKREQRAEFPSGIPGVSIEIGEPVSMDGGATLVIPQIRNSLWFQQLVPALSKCIAGFDTETFGFSSPEKLERGLTGLIAGLAMGYRTTNAIAEVIHKDSLWNRLIGKRVSQPDFSRLLALLAQIGPAPLKRAVAGSASEGRDGVYIDGDSTLIELHGSQEGASYNGHYHALGYHAGWMVDTESGRLVALWLNPGKAYTSEGQASILQGLHEQGLSIRAYRGDAGMPSPELFSLLDEHKTSYTMRLKSNARLDKYATQLLPAGPWQASRVLMGDFSYAAKSWANDRRVVAKLQKPVSKNGQDALFWEGFYFVTSREDSPETVVSHYLERGRAEGIFGEFMRTMQPNFRHEEMGKNEVWAQLLAMAFNVLVNLRMTLPGEGATKRVLRLEKDLCDPGFVTLAIQRVKQFAKASLTMFRTHALKLHCVFVRHARKERLRIHPTLLRPQWPSHLLEILNAPLC